MTAQTTTNTLPNLSGWDDSFRTFLIVSLALHLALITGMAVKHWLMPGKIIVIPEAIRVDVVALPDKMPKMMPVPQVQAPKPISIQQPAHTAIKQNLKAEQKQAFAELKAMEEIQKMQKALTAQNTNAPAPPKPKKVTYKGNIISSGDSFSGLARLRVNQYLSEIKNKIHAHWMLPQWLSQSNLKAQIVVTLDASGNITRSQIYVSSGNTMFDNSCLAAVQQSSPFPPPPEDVQGAILLIHFPF